MQQGFYPLGLLVHDTTSVSNHFGIPKLQIADFAPNGIREAANGLVSAEVHQSSVKIPAYESKFPRECGSRSTP
jgi:hypothetical protein